MVTNDFIMIKIIIITIIIAIIISLGSALFAMVKGGRDNKDKSDKMFKSLALRVSLSVFLFVLLIISYYLGWIQPVNSLNK